MEPSWDAKKWSLAEIVLHRQRYTLLPSRLCMVLVFRTGALVKTIIRRIRKIDSRGEFRIQRIHVIFIFKK